jgi:hypothetical protein
LLLRRADRGFQRERAGDYPVIIEVTATVTVDAAPDLSIAGGGLLAGQASPVEIDVKASKGKQDHRADRGETT